MGVCTDSRLSHETGHIEQNMLSNWKEIWRTRGCEVYASQGANALCGDSVTVAVACDATGAIVDVVWCGYACALCMASADAAVHLLWEHGDTKQSISHEQVVAKLGNPQVRRTRQACIELPISSVGEVLAYARGTKQSASVA